MVDCAKVAQAGLSVGVSKVMWAGFVKADKVKNLRFVLDFTPQALSSYTTNTTDICPSLGTKTMF